MSFKLLRNLILIIYVALGGLFLFVQFKEIEVTSSGLECNGSLKQYYDLKRFEQIWNSQNRDEIDAAPSALKDELKEYNFLVLALREQIEFDKSSEEIVLLNMHKKSLKLFAIKCSTSLKNTLLMKERNYLVLTWPTRKFLLALLFPS